MPLIAALRLNHECSFSVILLFIALLFSVSAVAQDQAKSLAFTQQQNSDGSKFVWFVYSKAGFDYEYFPTAKLPNSVYFKQVEKPQSGDVVHWSEYMAVVDMQQGESVSILVAGNEYSFEELSKLYGKPSYYRFLKDVKKP